MTQASQQLCGGIFKIVFAFRIEGRIREPSHLTSHLSCERLRYEHRLMPFCNVIAPPAVPYQQYTDLVNQFLNAPSLAACSAELYAGAFQCFDEAKRLLMMIPDPSQEVSPITCDLMFANFGPLQITSCLRVAKTNQVVAKILASGIRSSSSKVCTERWF